MNRFQKDAAIFGEDHRDDTDERLAAEPPDQDQTDSDADRADREEG